MTGLCPECDTELEDETAGRYRVAVAYCPTCNAVVDGLVVTRRVASQAIAEAAEELPRDRFYRLLGDAYEALGRPQNPS